MRKTRESKHSSASELGWMPSLLYYTPLLADPSLSQAKSPPKAGPTSPKTSLSLGRWMAAAVCQLAFLFGMHAAPDQGTARLLKKSDARKATQKLFE